VDIKAVKARRDAISGQSRTGVETWMKGLKSCTVYEGHGHFLSSHEIAVGDEVLAAEKIFSSMSGAERRCRRQHLYRRAGRALGEVGSGGAGGLQG
jgi:pyruvate/2-oxoglutarate dehydrogenase complex dihydrolipoamide dehydrogenase (E3) component